ncbi:MAG: hypothetical protein ACOYNF_11695 [Rhodoferax sp.]
MHVVRRQRHQPPDQPGAHLGTTSLAQSHRRYNAYPSQQRCGQANQKKPATGFQRQRHARNYDQTQYDPGELTCFCQGDHTLPDQAYAMAGAKRVFRRVAWHALARRVIRLQQVDARMKHDCQQQGRQCSRPVRLDAATRSRCQTQQAGDDGH